MSTNKKPVHVVRCGNIKASCWLQSTLSRIIHMTFVPDEIEGILAAQGFLEADWPEARQTTPFPPTCVTRWSVRFEMTERVTKCRKPGGQKLR